MKRHLPHQGKPAPTIPPAIGSISELAGHLGLSYCTVSRAINGHRRVSQSTRDRVFKAMEETGFRPNPFARSLRGKGMGLVGVCVNGLRIPILEEKVFELQEFLRRRNFRGLIEIAGDTEESERRILEDFIRIRVEGIVNIYSKLHPGESFRILGDIPCVFIDPMKPQDAPCATLDRSAAMTLLLQHLIDLGHRRFGLIGITPEDKWRWPALAATAERNGLNAELSFVFAPRPGDASSIVLGSRLAKTLQLASPSCPRAIIALDDLLALGAVRAVQEAGFQVPKDFSVTGFDHIELARVFHPTLTTIEQRPEDLAKIAGALLLDELSLPPKERGRKVSESIAPLFVRGESTGPAPARL